MRTGFRSAALGIEKPVSVYLPPGYEQSDARLPVLYLFRGHEREWRNPVEDAGRGGRSVVDLLDAWILDGRIRPVIAVFPGLTSDDGRTHGLGVDMRNPGSGVAGIGFGRFERYLVHELIPHVDAVFRTRARRSGRAVDGFSLGGYTAMLLVARHPRLFGSAGCYDGTHMWAGFRDPRVHAGGVDRVWLEGGMFDAAFGRPRDRRFMDRHNPTDLIARAEGARLDALRGIAFHIQSAAVDAGKGNLDRGRHFVSVLERAGMINSFRDVRLASNAVHGWKWADLHMRAALPLHDAVFSESRRA